jgi:uncharacterized protein YjbI with pentapeptide repeats
VKFTPLAKVYWVAISAQFIGALVCLTIGILLNGPSTSPIGIVQSKSCQSRTDSSRSGLTCFAVLTSATVGSTISIILVSVGCALIGGLILFLLVNIYLTRFASLQEESMHRTALLNDLRAKGVETRARAVEEASAKGWFADGTLEGASLDDVNLSGADLTAARLSRASMMGANLDGAVLIKASLRGTLLLNASFKETNLTACDLTGAELNESALLSALMCWGARMPDGVLYDGRFNLSGDIAYARDLGVDVASAADMTNFYEAGSRLYA